MASRSPTSCLIRMVRRERGPGTPPALLSALLPALLLAAFLPTASIAASLPIAESLFAPLLPRDAINITRNDFGDSFSFKGEECSRQECGGRTAGLTCSCSCPVSSPLFREDKIECVNDIAECSVAPFGSGSSAQKVPYIFLPLQGQIIHPSKEISFPGVRTPICAVSGAQFLTRNGFVDLRNTVDSDVPFSLFRDEGRTFLQWTGEAEVRSRMEGRLLVVQLLCRDVGSASSAMVSGLNPGGSGSRGLHGVFTPCAAFRVAGSPARHVTNVSEVLFSPDARSSDVASSSAGLSLAESIAIGISSVMLGLIYVASVFLYLHIKKRRTKKENLRNPKDPELAKRRDPLIVDRERKTSVINATGDDVMVKSNPLMIGMGRHFRERDKGNDDFESDSPSCSSDADDPTDETTRNDMERSCHQITSATVHPMAHASHNDARIKQFERMRLAETLYYREESNMERLPEENVSIIESIDMRDEKSSETIRAIGSTRRKLYFNPAYFEPHLLMAPPPAAVEFLMKIREVISIAKHKMATKRFTPSLIGIPEEDNYRSIDAALDFYRIGSQRSSVVSLKRENIRRRPFCSGCPGCESRDMYDLSAYIPEFRTLATCSSCSSANGVNKQNSIRKWLEGVPILKSSTSRVYTVESDIIPDPPVSSAHGLLNSLLSLPRDNSECLPKRYDFGSRSLYAEDNAGNFMFKKKRSEGSVRSEPSYSTFNIPLPSFNNVIMKNSESEKNIASIKDISPVGIKGVQGRRMSNRIDLRSRLPPPPALPPNRVMPDMINEALAIDKHTNNTLPKKPNSHNHAEIVGNTEKKRSDETIKVYSDGIVAKRQAIIEYETDSLERCDRIRGLSTPTEYGDVSSSQASPSLSNALPLDEEMTMRNATYKINTISRPTSRLSTDENDKKMNDDYEIVEKLPTSAFDNHIYSLPEMTTDSNGDYSLVSEVYVNNGYNFGSNPTSPSGSECSTFGKRKAVIRYDRPNDRPGQLTIVVKENPENYIKIHESDGFEPDTLDRKPAKSKIDLKPRLTERNFSLNTLQECHIGEMVKSAEIYVSLEHSQEDSKHEGTFQSLREIYEKNTKPNTTSDVIDTNYKPTELPGYADYEIVGDGKGLIFSDEGRLLTLESRHCKRQRQSTPPSSKGTNKPAPPDVIPPADSIPIYEYPKPPRRVIIDKMAPPLPPKNDSGRSPSSRNEEIISATAGRTSEPSSGQYKSPAGTTADTEEASDYENAIPNSIPLPPRQPKIFEEERLRTLRNLDRLTSSEPQLDVQSKANIGKIPFRELQTPKAGKKIRSIGSPKKIKDRAGSVRKYWRRATGNQYIEDSGYLSTESDESRKMRIRKLANERISGSETDESVEDARSESGAESVETHSVFFGSFRKASLFGSSVDSGTGFGFKRNGLQSSSINNDVTFMKVLPASEPRTTVSDNNVTHIKC